MKIGPLRERITIESPPAGTSITDSATTWSEVCQVWARVERSGSSETNDGERITRFSNIVCTIRYRTDITELMRISWDDKYWVIQGEPISDERKNMLTITAAARVARFRAGTLND